FLGCTGYPECRNIRKIGKSGVAAPPPVPIDEKCPVDGAQLVKRVGRFGEFYSCSEYPNCNVVYWDKPVLETCPDCNAPFLLEKTTKKQGTFRYCANEDC